MTIIYLLTSGVPMDGIIPNPPAAPPPGAVGPVTSIISYVKWGVLAVIFIAGFVGAGALAGGRIVGNHGASKVGVSMLVGAAAAMVVYVAIYAFLTGFGGT